MKTKKKPKFTFKNILAFFLCLLMVFQTLAEPVAVYAATPSGLLSWSTLKANAVDLTNASNSSITDMKTKGINMGLAIRTGYTWAEVANEVSNRITYQKAFKTAYNTKINLVAGKDGGESAIKNDSVAYGIWEFDDAGSLLFSSNWLKPSQTYTVGVTTDGTDYASYTGGTRASRVKYIVFLFRYVENGDFSNGVESPDITAAELEALFPSMHICAKSFTYTIDANNGTDTKTVTRYGTEGITPLSNPTKTGYTFQGWKVSSGNTSADSWMHGKTYSTTQLNSWMSDNKFYVSLFSDVTFTAQWAANTYTVTYNANGGTTSATGKTLAYGAAVDLSPTASKPGYTFIGWSTSSTARIPLSSYSMPAGDVTLYAVYSIEVSDVENHDYPSYTATGNISNDEVYLLVWITASPSVYKFYPLTYTKDMNTLVYRYTLPATDISSFVNGHAYSYQLVVYDNAGNYTVLYKGGNAGDTQPENIVKPEYNQTVKHYKYNPVSGKWILFETTNSLIASGNTFTPAYVTPPAGYSASSKDAGKTVTSANTYNAYYRPNTYTVIYNANGGTVTPASQSVTYSSYYPAFPTPNRTGYTFTGWNTAANGTGTTVSAGDIYTIVGNQTLYAQWKANVYEIKLDSQGAELPGTKVFYQKYGSGNFTADTCTTAVSKITVPVKTGYTFGGYYTEKCGAGTRYIDAAGNILSTKTTFTESTTLYAKWTANTYTIRYNANGGNGTMADTVATYDTSVKLSSNLYERTGYSFKGWAASADGAVIYTDKQSVSNLATADGAVINLYAVWNINSYTVTYDYWTNGGSSAGKESAEVNYNAAIDLSTPAEKGDGFTFVGWNTDASATTGLTSLTMGTEPVMLYAVFKKDISVTLVERDGDNTIQTVLQKTIYNNTQTADFVISESGSFDGWTNTGWSSATEAGASADTATGATYSTRDSVTLYALYVSDVTLSYDTNGSAVGYDSQTGERYYNASGAFRAPTFRLEKAPVLSGHSFDKWVSEENMEYAADTETVIEKDTRLTARWDKYPELSVSNRYFTLEQAKSGEITQAELLRKVKAVDREDGTLVNGKDVIVTNYNTKTFTDMTTDSQVEITYKATDRFGNVVEKTITVFVTDTSMRKSRKKNYVRFISEEFFIDEKGDLIPFEKGGLEKNSIWRLNLEYRNLLQQTLSKEGAEGETYFFTLQEIQCMKEKLPSHISD
ncbi:MAG: InlB B-repeat-containing protein [Agathobacter sp.]|nr:InlB B-repeat-containing protein [Agathobacter sp.]